MLWPVRYTEALVDQYRRSRNTVNKTLWELWEANAARFPDREALVDSRLRLTWSQAMRYINSIAIGLVGLGIGKNEIVVLQLPNCVELLLTRMACEKAGIICLPIQMAFREREMGYILSHLQATAAIVPYSFHGFNYYDMITGLQSDLAHLGHIIVQGEDCPAGGISLQEMMERPHQEGIVATQLLPRSFRGPELCYINVTSGTTGFPKFVEYAAWSRPSLGKAVAERLQVTADDIFGVFCPVAGGPNTASYYAASYVGGKIVMQEKFEAGAALELIQSERVTVAALLDTMLAKMIAVDEFESADLSSVRIWYGGGSPLFTKQVDALEQGKGGLMINIYGAADFGGVAFADPSLPRQARVATGGQPLPGVEFKIVDDHNRALPPGEVGELWAWGEACAAGGYHSDPEANQRVWTSDGWFKTGDLARFDAGGNLVIVGRIKDMIRRGGQNIYPAELENLLLTHAKIADVAVVAMPDLVMGEKVCAYVVLREGEHLAFEAMVSFLRANKIATYKLPERLELLPELPLTHGEGHKVDKKLLREDVARKLSLETAAN